MKPLMLLLAILFAVTVNFSPRARQCVSRHILARARSMYAAYQGSPTDESISPRLAQHIEAAVREAMLRQLGPRDYALALDGAKIVPALTTGTPPPDYGQLGRPSTHPAHVILRENLHGGRCWNMSTVDGQVGIALPEIIRPTAVAIEHLPVEIADEGGIQAPHDMRLWGLLEGRANIERHDALAPQEHISSVPATGPPITGGYTFVRLADFEYDVSAPGHIQAFPIDPRMRRAALEFAVFVIEILNNWGGNATCLYRVRIHGHGVR